MGLLIEKGCFHRTGNHLVQWVHVKNRRVESKGVIFAPPLIGAGFTMEINNLRRLAKKGYELFSFNYAGHGKSSDRFRPRATLADTARSLEFLLSRATGKPVYGIASCYSAIPLLHAAHQHDEPLEKIILINAICHLNPRAVLLSFASYYKSSFSGRISVIKIQTALQRYAAFLFPGIAINRNFFGCLLRQRTDVARTLWDGLFLDPLQRVHLHRTPVLGLYARQDRILKIYDRHVGEDYEKQIRLKCPLAVFHALPGDHFLSSLQTRELAHEKILAFIERPGSQTGFTP
jgi:pimeloyl-ACP methyl ester carboxylesterase